MFISRNFIILTALISVLVVIASFLVGTRYQEKMNGVRTETDPRKQNITEAQILSVQPTKEAEARIEYKTQQIERFKKEMEKTYSNAQTLFHGKEIVNAIRIREDNNWLIETVNLNGNGNRTHYLITPDTYKELSKQPTPCFIDDYEIQRKDNDISVNTLLKEDRLVLYIMCRTFGGYPSISLFNYETLEQINFVGGDVDVSGNAKGHVVNWYVSRPDPAIAIDIYYSEDPESFGPSKGLNIYSIRTGQLLNSFSNN